MSWLGSMKYWILAAALNGAMAVAAGAWGWHAMAEESRNYLPIFQVGVRYQMWHALALIGVAWLADRVQDRFLVNIAGGCFVLGSLLFSGALYILALSGEVVLPGVAPVGGALLIVGWLAIAVAAFRLKS